MFLYIEKKVDRKKKNTLQIRTVFRCAQNTETESIWACFILGTTLLINCMHKGRRATNRLKESDLVRDSSHHSLSVTVCCSFRLYYIS